jgi:hypothetical protein
VVGLKLIAMQQQNLLYFVPSRFARELLGIRKYSIAIRQVAVDQLLLECSALIRSSTSPHLNSLPAFTNPTAGTLRRNASCHQIPTIHSPKLRTVAEKSGSRPR